MTGRKADQPQGRGFRQLSGPARWIERSLLAGIPLAGVLYITDIHSYLRIAIYREQYLGLLLTLALASVFLTMPAKKGGSIRGVPWYDALLATLAFLVGLYIVILYPSAVFEIGIVTPEKVALGSLAVLLVLEATRRATGWPLVLICGAFILYGQFAGAFPGLLQAKPIPWPKLVTYLYLDSNALLGMPFAIAGTVALAFILFGQFLFAAGGGRFLTDLSMVAFGKYRGGPAKMAVMSSALFGTISGSPVANVYTTGTVTIPLMKRIGYRPELAGAIEAVASTGGQIMPPVMGVVAFMIADFLAVPYWQVAGAAFLPALLYYTTLFTQVDLEAAKAGMKGLPAGDLPPLGPTLRLGWSFAIPLLFLVYTLFVLHFNPAKSAVGATVVVFLLSLVRRETRLGARALLGLLESTGRVLLDIAMITAAVGFFIGVFLRTGIGPSISFILIELGGGHALILLLWAAIASMVLGLGMNVGTVYLLLAVLVAPALAQIGIDPLAAHLFIFYYGVLEFITPPLALAAYAGANLAGAAPMRTGFLAMRLAMVAYVIPFIFVFSPPLLMRGAWETVLLAVGTALVGTYLLGAAFTGFVFRPLSPPKRVALTLAGLALLIPPTEGVWLGWLLNGCGLGVGGIILLQEWRQSRQVLSVSRSPAPADLL